MGRWRQLKKLKISKYLSTVLYLIAFNNSANSLTIDKKMDTSNNFLLTSHYELPYIAGYTLLATSLIEGNHETRFGKTTLKALDSFIWTNLTVEAMKKTFRRVRPRSANSPNEWFVSSNVNDNDSFPSGHVASMTSMVVPYFLEYKKDSNLAYALLLLPLQQMAGRVNAQAHWQTDVLIAGLIGSAFGWYSHSREKPLFLYFTNDGIFTGLRYKF